MTPQAVAAPENILVDWDARTDKGGREDNQDAVRTVPRNHAGIAQRGWLLVVCDGVGGEAGGHLASTKAADAALQAYYEEGHGDAPRVWLDAAAKRAHLAVLREATTDSALRRMSTTLVAVAVVNGKAYVAHVGDSRAYLVRNGSLIQLTRDHKNEATNSITRSLGAGANHDAEFLAEPVTLTEGDRLLLCSDGVYSAVDEATLVDVLARHPRAIDAANALLTTSVQRRTDDNVTAAVLNFGEVPNVQRASTIAPSARRIGPWVGVGVLIGLLAAVVALLQPRLSDVSSARPTPLPSALAQVAASRTPAPQSGVEAAEPTDLPTVAPILEQTQQAVVTRIAATRAAQAAAQAATQIAAAKTRAAIPTATAPPTPTPVPLPTPAPAQPPELPESPTTQPPPQPTSPPAATEAPTQVPATAVPTSAPTQPPPPPTAQPTQAAPPTAIPVEPTPIP
jgi:protein phosphatase